MNAGIAVVPGSAFGKDFTGYARLSFSTLAAPVISHRRRENWNVIAPPPSLELCFGAPHTFL